MSKCLQDAEGKQKNCPRVTDATLNNHRAWTDIKTLAVCETQQGMTDNCVRSVHMYSLQASCSHKFNLLIPICVTNYICKWTLTFSGPSMFFNILPSPYNANTNKLFCC